MKLLLIHLVVVFPLLNFQVSYFFPNLLSLLLFIINLEPMAPTFWQLELIRQLVEAAQSEECIKTSIESLLDGIRASE